MTLNDLQDGETAVITDISAADFTVKRLADMGILSGVKVTLIKRAPFFDPIEIRVFGIDFAIRQDLANRIKVERV